MPEFRHERSMWSAASDASNAAGSRGEQQSDSHGMQPDLAFSRPVNLQYRAKTKMAVGEDEGELQDYFRRVLPYLGYAVVGLASIGEELVHLCRRAKPELLITDIYLSGISGPEAVKVIRQEYPIAAIYITENPREDMAAQLALNAAVLTKPFQMADLTSAIQLAMSIRPDADDFAGTPC